MRTASPLILLSALVAFALPAAAQTQFADSSGFYVGLTGLGFGSARPPFRVDGTLGYRLNGGTDVGVRLQYSRGQSVGMGPVAGRTWAAGRGVQVRTQVGAFYFQEDYAARSPDTFENERLARRDVVGDAALTVSRPLRLVGSLRITPTIGVYGAARQNLSFDYPDRDTRFRPGTGAQAGLIVGAPVSFRLFGATATLQAGGRIPLVGTDGHLSPGFAIDAHPASGFQLNF